MAKKKSPKKPVKKKSTKKKVVKKAAKKSIKPVVKKSTKKAETEPKTKSPSKKSLSRRVCELLVEKTPDEEIAEILKSEYPEYKHASSAAINYYRNHITQGKMEKMGFFAKDLEEKSKSSKKSTKKKESKKVASRVK